MKYKLYNEKTNKFYYYVYWITSKIDGKHYIGSRGSKKLDLISDLKKYGSTSCRKDDIKNNPENYVFTILRVFKTRNDAYNYEILLHNKFNISKNENFFNKSKQTTNKFSTSGLKPVYDNKTNKFILINVENFDENKHEKCFCVFNILTNAREYILHRDFDEKVHKTGLSEKIKFGVMIH